VGSSFIFINGLRVHYLRWSAAEEKYPIIMVHGLASNARIWELAAPLLAKRGFSCYAPDGRGHGLTDKPDNGYDTETMTGDLASFMETCEIERPLLVGHSWGASIVLNYASQLNIGMRAPRGIVLIDGGIVQMDQQPGMTWEKARDILTPPKLTGMQLDEFLGRLRGWTADWDPENSIFPIVLANFQIEDDDTISPRLTFERHMLIVRSIWEFQTYERFRRVHRPVLIIPAQPKSPMSESDKEFIEAKKRGIQKAAEAIRDLNIYWMEDSVHDIPLQHPVLLAEKIAEFADDLL
jgi:pimeloyl-ACP methyl ester carboxylesterase